MNNPLPKKSLVGTEGTVSVTPSQIRILSFTDLVCLAQVNECWG